MDISVRFHHGLGDAANFAHAIPLFLRRGHAVAVECTRDKEPIFLAAGATITPKARDVHPYPHAPHVPPDELVQPWQGNKVGHGSFVAPMPPIGSPGEVWEELCAVRLSIKPRISPEDFQYVGGLVGSLPRPLILLHTRGNSTPHKTNLDEATERDLYFWLLHRTAGTVILLDWDHRVGLFNHHRLRHMERDLARFNVRQLAALMELSDLFIGVDSGPLNFARMTSVNVLGVWLGHYPANFVLPSDRALHLVAPQHRDTDRRRRVPYNTELLGDAARLGEAVADRASGMLGGPRYLAPGKIGRDVQLQSFVRRTISQAEFNGGLADRSATFDAALRFLSKRAAPNVVETGCIRAEEDWAGAGYSTYLFGAFLSAHGGQLYSFDLNERNVSFARVACRAFGDTVKAVAMDSVCALEEFKLRADLVYLDSADVGVPGYQEHCLREATAAVDLLDGDGCLLIDDTPWGGGKWHGKGALAVPWLLNHGWRVVKADYQVLLRRPKAG